MSALIDDLNKQFGKSTVIDDPYVVRDVIPTGSLLLDRTIGVGGYPVGKITEIYGAESVGKSTLCLSAIRQAQLKGMGAVYIDAENSFDTEYAKALGVSVEPEDLIVIQPGEAEKALAILEKVIQSPAVGLVVLDSVAAMVPKRESFGEGELGDSHVGLIARLMSQAARRLTPLMAKSNTALIMVNQIREQIGGSAYVQKESPGGHALKHSMHLRLELKRRSTKTDTPFKGDTSIEILVKIKKTKISSSRDSIAEVMMINGRGIDIKAEISKILLEEGVIKAAGSWYKTEDDKTIGQGVPSLYTWIDNNQEIVLRILKEQGVNPIYANISKKDDHTGNKEIQTIDP